LTPPPALLVHIPGYTRVPGQLENIHLHPHLLLLLLHPLLILHSCRPAASADEE